MIRHRPRRRGQRAQALVETMLALPLLLALITGEWNAAELSSAQNQATVATRDAARLAASLGSAGSNPVTGPFDPSTVDQQIVQTVLAAMSNVRGAAVDHIDIYQPAASSGTTQVLTDCYLADGSDCSGYNPVSPTAYTLDKRIQAPPAESYIGVNVVYQFTAPVPMMPFFSGLKSSYTVMQMVPY